MAPFQHGVRATFHRPHLKKETDKGALVLVRCFLENAGVQAMMKYKGYTGHVEYDDDARIFHGEVLGIKDVVTFQGTTIDEIEQSFKDSSAP